MAEYIERERLKQAFRTDTEHLQVFDSSMYEILMIDVDELPAADVAPVRHGRWVAVPSSDMMTGKAYKCSECNKMRYGSFMPNYCQNCGAKMDLEVTNDA